MSDDLELTGNEAGVGEQVVAPEGAAESELTATPTAPVIAEKVDLTKSEEFRRWQAASDRRTTQLKSQLTDATQQMQAMQRQMEEYQLADADPTEAAKYYQEQLSREREEYKHAHELSIQEQTIIDKAMQLLSEHGMTKDTPGLDWSDRPSWEGYAALASSVAVIERQRGSKQAEAKKAELAEVAQVAKTEALEQAGVTKVSTATGATPPNLRNEYEAEIADAKARGNRAAISATRAKYRKKGLAI